LTVFFTKFYLGGGGAPLKLFFGFNFSFKIFWAGKYPFELGKKKIKLNIIGIIQ